MNTDPSRSNPEEVERLVALLMNGIQQGAGDFTGSDGMSAAITFTYRFAHAVITLIPEREQKELAAATIAASLRRVAMMVESAGQDLSKEKVH